MLLSFFLLFTIDPAYGVLISSCTIDRSTDLLLPVGFPIIYSVPSGILINILSCLGIS